MRPTFSIVLFILAFNTLKAQTVFLGIKQAEGDPSIKYKKELKSIAEAKKEAGKILQQYYEEGYIGAQALLKKETKDSLLYEMERNEIFQFGILNKGNAEEEMLSKIGFREKIYRGKKLDQKSISRLAESVIEYYENNGYPFATFRLENAKIEKGIFDASLKIEKGFLYRIDSLIIKGGSKIKKAYIENHLSIKEGDVYDERLISAADAKIKELAFAEWIKPTEVVFTKTQCFVYVYINEKKSSQFNGILGILPDNNTGKITLTGDARIRLRNTLHSGELFDLNWRKLNTDVQDLRIHVNYPFLFKSNFGTDLLFKLYKKDSTFIELNQQAGILYMLRSGNFLKVSLHLQTSNLITPKMFENATSLPEFADVNTLLYGIGTKVEKLDYRLNPSKGFSLEIDMKAGSKNIRINPFIDADVYENLKLKTVKYHLVFNGEFYFSPIKRTAVKFGNQTGWIENENLFVNELFRIGGLRTLRGFNEESLFASFYAINTFEFRFLLEQNSNLYVFYDYCYYERKLETSYFHDTPYGFGAGISFQTKAGIFSMNYGLGTEQGNPIQLRGAKVHFGFVNYF